jgi:arylformamidase
MVDMRTSLGRAFWEAEYNPRFCVRDAQRYFDGWSSRATHTRAKLAGAMDLAYGTQPRERLDLFRADDARGTLVFLHGGYWRAFAKEDFSWVAEPFVRAGISVAIPSFPLCPAVRLKAIVQSASAAVTYLQRTILSPLELQKTVLLGHSAGAHIAACLMAARNRDGPAVDAIVCISGLFDLLPLLHTDMLSGMGWRPAELHAASPLYMVPPENGTVVLAVGGDETREFHEQSARFGRAWAERMAGTLCPAGRNHFSVIDDLHRDDYELTRAAVALFTRVERPEAGPWIRER